MTVGYVPPQAQEKYSDPNLTRLDTNEVPYCLVDETVGVRDLNHYVHDSHHQLIEAIAAHTNTEPDQIVVGNGSSHLLDLTIGVYGGKGVASCDPAYRQYRHLSAHRKIPYVDIPTDDNLRLAPKAFASTESDIDLQIIANPNNPTGALEDLDTIREIAEIDDRYTAVDEAYIEFAGEENSAIQLIRTNKRLLVIRTFSKAFGAAALRLGYTVCDPSVANELRARCTLYPTSAVQEGVGLRLLSKTADMRTKVQEIVQARDSLTAELSQIGCEVFPSRASFVLIRPPQGLTSDQLHSALLERKIVVRSNSDQIRVADMLRVSIGTPEMNRTFIEALKEIIQSPPAGFQTVA